MFNINDSLISMMNIHKNLQTLDGGEKNKYEVLIDVLMQRLKERDIDILESLVIIKEK